MRRTSIAALALTVTIVGLTLPLRRMQIDRIACGREWLTEPQLAARFGVTVDILRRARSVSSVTYESLCTMPPRLRDKALRKAAHPKPDHPGEAIAFRRLSLQDENGQIAPGALIQAAEEVQRMRQQQMVTNGAGVSSGSWSWIGPGNIGGRVRSILVNPATASTMLVGSVGGGIWRTTNGGTSWAPVQDFMANLAVATMVAQPNNFDIQYAGTGEGFYNTDGIRGAGIFKSTDQGVTWSQLSATNTVSFQFVNRLAMSADSTTLLAATRSGIYRSVDGGVSFGLSMTGGPYGVMDLDFHPTDSSRAIAGGHEGKAWYSVNGGVSWVLANGLPVSTNAFRRVEVAYARSNPSIVYASIDLAGGSLYKSVDGGVNYSLVFNASPDYLGGQGWYDHALWIDPTNPDFLVVGGIDLYRSTNGGVSFTAISSWWASPPSAHADQHMIVEAPGYDGGANRAVLFVNDGGIFRAPDVSTVGNNASAPYTNGWQELNNNLGVTQFYGAGVDGASGKVIGGTQDNGTLTYTTAGGSEGWVAEFGGDGGFSAVDYVDPNYCYGEYVYLEIHRSSTGCGGGTGNYIYSGITDAGSSANFIAPFILDPNDPQRLLGGGSSLWRTDNARASTPVWTAIKPSAGPNYISAIAVQEGNPDQIWVGHNNGDVYKTTNGSSASPIWAKMDGTTLPNRYVTRVAIDKFNPDTIYVTFGGFANDNIYVSYNGGTNWANIHGSLPAAPIRSIVMHPALSSWLYIGTEVGVFVSENGGASWFLPPDGPANVSVDELFFGYGSNVLHAATHGRGVFRATVGPLAPPGTAVLIAPNTYLNNTTPTYQWRAAKGATYYQLFVADRNVSGVINTWYTKEEAGCPTGIGTCQVTPPTALATGAATWWVRTWSPGAYAPWSSGLRFFTDTPTASVTSLFPVPRTTGGQPVRLWARVRNTGLGLLPPGSRVWFYVSGPGVGAWIGSEDVSNLPPGADVWFSRDWEVPIGQTPGAFSYGAQVWWGGALPSSPFNGYELFTVDATPAAAARILSSWVVKGSVSGGTVRLWSLIKNVGTDPFPSNGNVWFRVSGPAGWCGAGCTTSWIGYNNAAGLPSGSEAWYYADWPIPASIPIGTNLTYSAQVWTSAPISPFADERAFVVGVLTTFDGSLGGWAGLNGSWTNDSGAYLYSTGINDGWVSAAYQVAGFSDFDFSARLWRGGPDEYANAIIVRGTATLTSSNTWRDAYQFQYTRNGFFYVLKYVGGAFTTLQGWTATNAIVRGSAWNELRVVATGTTLSYFINGTLVWSGSDPSFSAGKVGVTFYRPAGLSSDALWIDQAMVDGGTVARLETDSRQLSQEQQERNDLVTRQGAAGTIERAPRVTGDDPLPNFVPRTPRR